MPIYNSNKKTKQFIGNRKIKKIYHGDTKVYSSGNVVTYWISPGVSYKEEVDDGLSILSPKTFTPTLSGWTFIGWRKDKSANGNILSNEVMGDDPITLYAVFRQTITLRKIINGSINSSNNYRYYNYGNILNSTFSLSDPTSSGATFKGWSTNGTTTVAYAPGTKSITISSNMTLYSIFQADPVILDANNIDGNGGWWGYNTSSSGHWSIPGGASGNWYENSGHWGNGYLLGKDMTGPLNNYRKNWPYFDCSKYQGIRMVPKTPNTTIYYVTHYKDSHGGLYATCGGTKTDQVYYYPGHDYLNGYLPAKELTIMFTQTSGLTQLLWYGCNVGIHTDLMAEISIDMSNFNVELIPRNKVG